MYGIPQKDINPWLFFLWTYTSTLSTLTPQGSVASSREICMSWAILSLSDKMSPRFFVPSTFLQFVKGLLNEISRSNFWNQRPSRVRDETKKFLHIFLHCWFFMRIKISGGQIVSPLEKTTCIRSQNFFRVPWQLKISTNIWAATLFVGLRGGKLLVNYFLGLWDTLRLIAVFLLCIEALYLLYFTRTFLLWNFVLCGF